VLWDLAEDHMIARLEGHKVQVFAARFVRGDHEILTAGGDGVARRWDAETGRLLRAYLGSSVFLLDAALDPDGSRVITAGGDGLLRFWDMHSGTLIGTLQAHRSPVSGIHFNGNELLTRGFNGELSRWQFPKDVSASVIDELIRCLPLRFDETTGSLVEQAPCDRP
jgi:WD40 repeat protein